MQELPALDGARGAETAGWGLCEPFMTSLRVSGALISVVDRSGHRSTIAATDPVAARWDELELELGIGPLLDATTDSSPQLIGNISTRSLDAVLGAPLERLGVRALFAFPLTMGLATVGVVGLYRTTVGPLTADSVGTALALARSTAVLAVREALRRAADNSETEGHDLSPGLRREVHQATGVLSVRLDTSITEAFARLRAHAISSERSITAVSQDIVDGSIDPRDFD